MSTIEFSPLWKEKLLNRFLNYVKIYSTSDAESETTPSTERQWDIANYITEELKTIGLENVSIDENGYIMGYVPSNLENNDKPTIGFISHYDTSPDFSGECKTTGLGKL
jgi:tripeptide aminopeptidase